MSEPKQQETKSIRQSLDEIARRVQTERDNKSVRTYGYEEKDGYLSASLTPVQKKPA